MPSRTLDPSPSGTTWNPLPGVTLTAASCPVGSGMSFSSPKFIVSLIISPLGIVISTIITSAAPFSAVPLGAITVPRRTRQSLSNICQAASGYTVERRPRWGIMNTLSWKNQVIPSGWKASFSISSDCALFGACDNNPPVPATTSTLSMSMYVPSAFMLNIQLISTRSCCTPFRSLARLLWWSSPSLRASRATECSTISSSRV